MPKASLALPDESSSTASKSHICRAGVFKIAKPPSQERASAEGRGEIVRNRRAGEEEARRWQSGREPHGQTGRVVGAAWAPICTCFPRRLVRRRGGVQQRAERRDRGYAFCEGFPRYDAHLSLNSPSLARLAAA